MVSVIITNYNYACFLEETIKSVLNQTYKDLEIIIVDDGSTDESRTVIDSYAAKYDSIKKIYTENKGQLGAFNLGYSLSKGDIICTLDSDDQYYPHMVERKVELHKKYDIVDSALSSDGILPLGCCRKDIDWSCCYREYEYCYSHMPTSGLSFSRRVLDKFMPLTGIEAVYGGLDRVLICLAMTQAEVGFDENLCGFYRKHNHNTTAERERFYNEREFSELMTMKLKGVVKEQLKKANVPIPSKTEDDFYGCIVESLKGDIGEKGIIIYGTSLTADKFTEQFIKNNVKIYGYSDSAEQRLVEKENDHLAAPYMDKTKLLDELDNFCKIVIASRQSPVIKKDLLRMGIPNDKILLLPI